MRFSEGMLGFDPNEMLMGDDEGISGMHMPGMGGRTQNPHSRMPKSNAGIFSMFK